jgi:uncharacterized protein (DUF4415 family)
MEKAVGSDEGETVTVTLRLSRKIVDHFRSLGPDWERAMGEALRHAARLRTRPPSPENLDRDFISDGNEG